MTLTRQKKGACTDSSSALTSDTPVFSEAAPRAARPQEGQCEHPPCSEHLGDGTPPFYPWGTAAFCQQSRHANSAEAALLGRGRAAALPRRRHRDDSRCQAGELGAGDCTVTQYQAPQSPPCSPRCCSHSASYLSGRHASRFSPGIQSRQRTAVTREGKCIFRCLQNCGSESTIHVTFLKTQPCHHVNSEFPSQVQV